MAEPKFEVNVGDPTTGESKLKAQTDYLVTVTTNLAEYAYHGERVDKSVDVPESEEGIGTALVPDRVIKVRKTFSDFLKLGELLVKGGIAQADKLPALPPKTMFGSNDPKTIEKRIKGFQAWWDHVALFEDVRSSQFVSAFLSAVPKPDYVQLKATLLEKAAAAWKIPENEWQVTKDSEKTGAKIMTKGEEGSKFVMVRSEIAVKTPVDHFISIYRDVEQFKNWCPEVSFRTVETVDDKITQVMNVSYKVPVLENRDTVFYTTEFPGTPEDPNKPGACFIAACSISHPECPKRRGYERAELFINMTVLEPCDGGLKYTSIVHTDPHGKVPAAVVNSTLGRASAQLIGMKEYVEKTFSS
mmetsp:Transcript_39313/g.47622  ORF Transcript_39313/g.47622 Transcript_39313/m.47622 type:complete len:358 (-) Transcript_39313:597-1670(-)